MRQDRWVPRRVLGYARVSSVEQEQHGTSLGAQRAELARYCRERGYPEPAIFVEVESGGLGKEEQRAEQVRLMNMVERDFMVLVCKQDRWSRDTLHFLASSRAIMTKGARFVSIAEQFDPSTPEGEFASTMMAATARMEHSRIRDRTVGSRQRLRALGAFVEGLPPLGYTVKSRKLVVEPKGAEVVRLMFDLCTSGHSITKIADVVRDRFPWVKGVDRSNISYRLRDRRYTGETNTVGGKRGSPAGEWIATHEALVDAATWRQAQAAMKSRQWGGRPPSSVSRNAGFLLRGMIRCGHCGHVLVAHAVDPRASVKHGGYYICRCRGESRQPELPSCDGPSARHADLDAEVEALALARLETLAERLRQPALLRQPKPPHDHDADRQKALKRQKNLIDAIADGTVQRDAARAKMQTIERELEAIERRRAKDAIAAAPRPDRSEMLAQVTGLRRAWGALSVDDKREAIRVLAARIELLSTATTRWQRGAWRLAIVWKKVE